MEIPEEVLDELEDKIELGQVIEINYKDDYEAYVGIVKPIINQIKTDKTIQDCIQEALLLTPENIKGMSLPQINSYLIMVPKALIYYQDCCNRAYDNLAKASNNYDDVITFAANKLDKNNFGKGINNITKEMRITKIKDMFPDKYIEVMKKVREAERNVRFLEGHIKHLQTLNDNLKKIRDSYITQDRSQE